MTWTADAYVTKSSNLDELKNKIKEVLENRSKSK
jgi:DNA-binding response OmpR family regulator